MAAAYVGSDVAIISGDTLTLGAGSNILVASVNGSPTYVRYGGVDLTKDIEIGPCEIWSLRNPALSGALTWDDGTAYAMWASGVGSGPVKDTAVSSCLCCTTRTVTLTPARSGDLCVYSAYTTGATLALCTVLHDTGLGYEIATGDNMTGRVGTTNLRDSWIVGVCYGQLATSSVSGDISTIVGGLARKVARTLAGALEPAASLAAKYIAGVIRVALAGALAMSGALTRGAFVTKWALSGAIATITGSITRKISRTLTAILTPLGTIADVMQRLLSGALSMSGQWSRESFLTHVSLSGVISFIVGTLTNKRIKPKHLRGPERPLHLTSNRRGERDREEY